MTNTRVGSIQNMQDNRHLNHTSIPWVMLSASLLYTHKKLVAEFYLPPRKFFKSEPSCSPWNHQSHGSCQQYLTAFSLSSLTSFCPLPFCSQYCLRVILLKHKSSLANEFQSLVIDHRIEFKLLPRAFDGMGICLSGFCHWLVFALNLSEPQPPHP